MSLFMTTKIEVEMVQDWKCLDYYKINDKIWCCEKKINTKNKNITNFFTVISCASHITDCVTGRNRKVSRHIGLKYLCLNSLLYSKMLHALCNSAGKEFQICTTNWLNWNFSVFGIFNVFFESIVKRIDSERTYNIIYKRRG